MLRITPVPASWLMAISIRPAEPHAGQPARATARLLIGRGRAATVLAGATRPTARLRPAWIRKMQLRLSLSPRVGWKRRQRLFEERNGVCHEKAHQEHR